MNEKSYAFEYARLEDLPRIVEIYNSTISGRMVTADLAPISVESRLPWFHDHTPDRRPLWVLKDQEQERIVAWVSLSNFYGRPAYNATAEISIYIAEECRGQGLGGYLIERVVAECPRLQVTTLLGFVFGHNEPSLRLLRKYGFEQWGYYPRIAVLDGVERDLAILGRRLD